MIKKIRAKTIAKNLIKDLELKNTKTKIIKPESYHSHIYNGVTVFCQVKNWKEHDQLRTILNDHLIQNNYHYHFGLRLWRRLSDLATIHISLWNSEIDVECWSNDLVL